MLTSYRAGPRGLEQAEDGLDGESLPDAVVWIDLLRPAPAEEAAVERLLGIEIPTQDDLREIEVSSRLYESDGALYMTILALTNADSELPGVTDVGFILTGDRLVTLRHDEPKPFTQFIQRAQRIGPAGHGADVVLMGLIEAFIDRVADVLEHAGTDADAISRKVFERKADKPMKTADFRDIVNRIGRVADITSKARESLVTIARLLGFLSTGTGEVALSREVRQHLKTALRDATQLSDHATYLGNKAEFLLEATVGLINIEQNNIIKLFSVAAVAMMPPTLIASIYGMNFRHMPELDEAWGYPITLGLMILSAVVPYLYFRWKGWL